MNPCINSEDISEKKIGDLIPEPLYSFLCLMLTGKSANYNIYILNVAALDETIIPSCLHFSMQNIEQPRGLCHASRWSNVNVN